MGFTPMNPPTHMMPSPVPASSISELKQPVTKSSARALQRRLCVPSAQGRAEGGVRPIRGGGAPSPKPHRGRADTLLRSATGQLVCWG